jgi:hypothetical protein
VLSGEATKIASPDVFEMMEKVSLVAWFGYGS